MKNILQATCAENRHAPLVCTGAYVNPVGPRLVSEECTQSRAEFDAIAKAHGFAGHHYHQRLLTLKKEPYVWVGISDHGCVLRHAVHGVLINANFTYVTTLLELNHKTKKQ